MGQIRTDNPPARGSYTLTNVAADRVLDCNSTSDAELADVLATLINDLAVLGILYSDSTDA